MLVIHHIVYHSSVKFLTHHIIHFALQVPALVSRMELAMNAHTLF